MSEKALNVADHSCRAIVSQDQGVPVVFLHGYSYTSAVWQRISVLELLQQKKIPFLALDMPYGAHSTCRPHSRSVEGNVAVVREALQTIFGSTVPVLVGASLGAHIALQFAARYAVKGLLLVGAIRVLESETLTKAYDGFKFPVRLIVGSEDHIASEEELRALASKLPDGKVTVYDGEGHSAYIGGVDQFKRDLLALYALVE